MRIADVIIKKRDGHALTDEEIRTFVRLLVERHLEDSQLGKNKMDALQIKTHSGLVYFHLCHVLEKQQVISEQ